MQTFSQLFFDDFYTVGNNKSTEDFGLSEGFIIFAYMKREVYESQKAFAGDKKPSMQRRCVGHDYTERQMYMVTMVVEGRRPLLGTVVGRSDAPAGSQDAPKVVLTELGQRVEACWHEIAVRQKKVKVLALQIMPDHFHGILFVTERLELPLGKVLLGFKQGCNKAYREVLSVAVYSNKQDNSKRTAAMACSLLAATMTSCCCARASYRDGSNIYATTPAVS